MQSARSFTLLGCALVVVVLASGCVQQGGAPPGPPGAPPEGGPPTVRNPVGEEPAPALETDGEEQAAAAARDPALEEHSRRLREDGIDCTHENTHGTRNSLAIDPRNPNILYVGIEGKGIYKSADKGATWKRAVAGLVAYPDSRDKSEPCFPDIALIRIDPRNTQRLLMVTSDITTAHIDWPYGETGGIWESLDGGASWAQLIRSTTINVAGSGPLAFDPEDSTIMYYPVNPDAPTFREAPVKASLNGNGSVYKTVDGGATWRELAMPMLPGLQVTLIALDPQDASHLVLFTQSHDHVYGEASITEVFLHEQHAILESRDAGGTWTTLGDTLPDPYRALFDGDVAPTNFRHMIVRPFLFGGEFPPETTRQKSFYSVDGGETFAETSMFVWVGRYDPHDREANHLLGYSPWQGWVVESTDAGRTWHSVGIPPEVENYSVKVEHFVWDPLDPATVYMSGDGGNVWQSADGGMTWKNILNDATLPAASL